MTQGMGITKKRQEAVGFHMTEPEGPGGPNRGMDPSPEKLT